MFWNPSCDKPFTSGTSNTPLPPITWTTHNPVTYNRLRFWGTYLEGGLIIPQLCEAFPNFPIGHSTANDITQSLADPQLLPVLLDGLLELSCEDKDDY